jgi:hypothetical protein
VRTLLLLTGTVSEADMSGRDGVVPGLDELVFEGGDDAGFDNL